MTRLRRLLVLSAATTALAGCGAASKEVMPPPEAPAGAAPDGDGSPAFQQGELRESEKKEAPPAEGSGEQPALGGLDDALDTLSAGETQLATALSSARDCETAKKALESMRRARERICDIQGPDDPGGRCTRASDQYDAAREMVRRACGD
jgi:hypothetical protein